MWAYDEFDPWYYGELDAPAGISFVQTGNVVLALSGGGEQEWPGGYVQNVDVVLGIYSSTTQEFQVFGGPQAYTQAGNAMVLLYGDAPQSYVPPNAGQDGQSGNVVLLLSGGAYQDWRAGGNPGDVIQNGDVVAYLAPSGIHAFTPPDMVRMLTISADTVRPFGVASVAPLIFHFAASNIPVSRVLLTFSSPDPLFSDPTPPAGGDMFVELATLTGGRRALVSVSAAEPSAEFFDGQGPDFDNLKAGILAGTLVMELRAYEALPGRVIGRSLTAGALTVESMP